MAVPSIRDSQGSGFVTPRGQDLTLLWENRKLSPLQRVQKMTNWINRMNQIRGKLRTR